MIQAHDSSALLLKIPARPAYLHVATDFAASSASAYGLGKDECLKLGLAVEEIFIHLCRAVCPEESLEIRSVNGIYYVRILFRFTAARLNMSGLNIATAVSCNRETDLEKMGLMLASRSVEHLHVNLEWDNRICLSVTKEKTYPQGSVTVNPGGGGSGVGVGYDAVGKDIFLEAPDTGHLKLLASAISFGGLSFVPPFFRYPGRVVDMVESGEYRAVAALNAGREIIGGALFRLRSEKIVEIFGPYVFGVGNEAAVSRLILEECIARLTRTKSLGLMSLWGIPQSSRERFEPLGTLDFFTPGGLKVERPSFYRHLHKGSGCEIWAHGDFVPFLRSECDRLTLARELRIVQPTGETPPEASLFAAQINREISEVVLRPVWDGGDLEDNIDRHVRYLRNEHVTNIFFELDLGMPWHARMMPWLAVRGFKPRLLLPFGGKADILVFQYERLAR